MIVAFTRCHYGADYLSSVIRSALPYVDKFIVLYTSVPTFGRLTHLACPDNRDTLFNGAHDAAGDKLDWRENLPISAEVAMSLHADTDLAIEMDADEVYHPLLLEHILESYHAGKLTDYCYRLPFYHHWRSFRYICEDSGWPARLYLPRNGKTDAVYYEGAPARVHHFGYARATGDMQYKWETSAHYPDLRSDWWSEIWAKFPDRLTDLHPVSPNFWDAKELEHCKLPPCLSDHAYAGLEVIQ